MSIDEKKERLNADNDFYDDDEDEDTQKDRFLTFRLSKEDYGIEIQFITEIIGIQKITEIPDMPNFIKGVINLRGKVIPVMDVRLRFNMVPKDYDDRTCIIVVNINDIVVGLVVDEVSEVVDIPEDQIEPPPRTSKKGTGSRFVKGIGKVGEDVKLILNVSTLLNDEELNSITDIV